MQVLIQVKSLFFKQIQPIKKFTTPFIYVMSVLLSEVLIRMYMEVQQTSYEGNTWENERNISALPLGKYH